MACSTPPAGKATDSSIKAPIDKKFKDAEFQLDVGRYWVDETVVVRVSGTVKRHEDHWLAPTISILLIPVITFLRGRLGVDTNRAMRVLSDAITEAMQAKVNESPSITSKMDDVNEAVAAVTCGLIGALPKMRRAGRTAASDLSVSVNALQPGVCEIAAARGGAGPGGIATPGNSARWVESSRAYGLEAAVATRSGLSSREIVADLRTPTRGSRLRKPPARPP